MESNDARSERLGVQKLESIDAHLLEDARPFSESKRIHKHAELIHKARFEHCVCQFAHAILQ
jgi:hypothetical protein